MDKSLWELRIVWAMALSAIVIVAVAAAFGGEPEGKQAIPCPEREAICVSGLIEAMNRSVRGRHDQAQEVALIALAAAGYRCSWDTVGTAAPHGEVRPPQMTLRCDG